MEENQHPVYRFVITGGPCGGKTTAMSELQLYLRENGFRVFIVPEAATMLFLNGASPSDFARPESQKAFQEFVINTQLQLEDSFSVYARSCQQKSVLLCDRGIMDGAAYVSKDVWRGVLSGAGMDTLTAREGRYNAVFHLVTAADGAEEFYTLSNNEARHETQEQAVVADRNTQAAWHGGKRFLQSFCHPHHIVIDNRNKRTFERKLEVLKSTLSTYVGLPSTLSRLVHRYEALSPPDLAEFPSHTEVFDIEKIILSANNDVAAGHESISSEGRVLNYVIRKRTQGESHAYGLATVRLLSSGEKVELKRIISAEEYAFFLASKSDLQHHVMKQRRYCFRWEHQAFHVSQLLEPAHLSGRWFVNVQSEADPRFPPFLVAGPELSTAPTQGLESSSHEISRNLETTQISEDFSAI